MASSRIKIFLAVFLNACVLCACGSDIDAPTVQIPNGKIQGTVRKNGDVTYLKFHGIPYAKPPVGKRRFAFPKPMSPWTGTWMANTTYTCLQVDHLDVAPEGLTAGTEDCLYANVLVPGKRINPEANLDVIVHIHGGGFMFGSGDQYAKPEPFMSQNVVFVTFNYRLGIFGFMSLEDRHVPGNNGMRDQVLALQWVKDNIKYFGGNPDSVTITGLSAGGASVHYHLLSPLSEGLFHKAISQSGNVLDPWTIHEAPRQKAKQLGRIMGCPYEDSKQFLGCLRTRPATEIVEATKRFRHWIYLPFSPFGLVVDTWAQEPFLPEHPYKLLKEGKVKDIPWIASLTTGEGLYPVAQLAAREEYFPEFAKNFEKHLPALLHYDTTVPKGKMNEVTMKIRKEYLKDKKIGLKTYTEIIKMASDRLFNNGMDKSIRMHSKAIKSPVYFYVYDYTSEDIWSFAELTFGYPEKYGVSHGDDTMMLFESPRKPSPNDAEMMDFLMKMWIDFAKTGKPAHPDWKPLAVGADNSIDYLYVPSADKIEMKSTKDLGRNAFWDALPIFESEKLFAKAAREEL